MKNGKIMNREDNLKNNLNQDDRILAKMTEFQTKNKNLDQDDIILTKMTKY